MSRQESKEDAVFSNLLIRIMKSVIDRLQKNYRQFCKLIEIFALECIFLTDVSVDGILFLLESRGEWLTI